MAARIKLGGKNKDDFDLMFEFRNVKVFVIANPEMYDDTDISKLEEIVKIMSRKIFIDKSYVDFPENKHRDTFLELEEHKVYINNFLEYRFHEYLHNYLQNNYLNLPWLLL